MPIGNETKELAWIRPDQIQPGVVKRALAEYQQLSGAVISDTPTPKRIYSIPQFSCYYIQLLTAC